MKVNRLVFSVVFLLPLTAFLAGCGEGEGNKVNGKVLLNGQPVGGATVTFIANDNSTSGSALTAGDGSFTITDATGKGLPDGTYKVVVSKVEVAGGQGNMDNPDDLAKMMQQAQAKPAKDLLPKKYKDVTTSDLTVTIPPSEDVVVLELSE